MAPFHDCDFLLLEEKRKQNTEFALAVLVLWDVEAIADHSMTVPGYVPFCVCVCVCTCRRNETKEARKGIGEKLTSQIVNFCQVSELPEFVFIFPFSSRRPWQGGSRAAWEMV